MEQSQLILVHGKEGLRGRIDPAAQPGLSGEAQRMVQLEDGRCIVVPTSVLVLQEDGSYYLPLSLNEVERHQSLPASETTMSMEGVPDQGTLVIPVIVEEMEVRKEKVETGRVRVTKTVHEHDEVVEQTLLREEVEVERVPINQLVEGPVETRQEGDTLIIPVFKEVLVFEKRLMLKEELRITKRITSVNRPAQVTLRSEEVHVERVDGDHVDMPDHAGAAF